mgnify:CR=1 FL=1
MAKHEETKRDQEELLQPVSVKIGDVNSDYIISIGKLKDRLLILLDLEKILSKSEFNILETAA